DAFIVGRNPQLIDAVRASGPLAHPDDERGAAQIGEGFSGEALGTVPRRNQCCEAHDPFYFAAIPSATWYQLAGMEDVDPEILAEIRRAAFELRTRDPQAAVRVLRRVAASGG